MDKIVYSKYYVFNTVTNRMDIYDNMDEFTLIKVESEGYLLILENGVELYADDSHGDFHFWGGNPGEYDFYFEVYLVELKEGDYDLEEDEVIEDDHFVKDQLRVGFINSGHYIIYND